VTDRTLSPRPLAETAALALEAGFAGVMLREKDLGGAELLDLAQKIAAVGALVINDRVDVALALPGAGAHIGARGIPVPQARRLLGPGRLLGYSAHEIDEAADALTQGADYVTLSPIRDPVSKSGRGRGMDFLIQACASLPPGRVISLGGMRPEDMTAVRAAGAAGAAVLGGVMSAPDPRAAAVAYAKAWRTAGGKP